MAEKDLLVTGLGAGADKYFTKPSHPGEPPARVGVGRRIADLYRQTKVKSILLEELAMPYAKTGIPHRRAVEPRAGKVLSAVARYDSSV
jgi:DNA-binding response OmpR family regulator